MNLFQLTYKSKSIENFEDLKLKLILDKSINNNTINSITGCLIYYNGNFIQILEGSEKDVHAVYSKILEDKRHHSIELMWENVTERRYFENWNMAFYSPENEDELVFLNNFKLLSVFADKSIGASLQFWASVERLLDSKNDSLQLK